MEAEAPLHAGNGVISDRKTSPQDGNFLREPLLVLGTTDLPDFDQESDGNAPLSMYVLHDTLRPVDVMPVMTCNPCPMFGRRGKTG
jgi:hypothetical protein